MKPVLTYVTSSKTKFAEALTVIPTLKRYEVDLTEIQSMDPKEIIKAKLLEAQRVIPNSRNRVLIVDDGAIVFDHFEDLPGTMSRYFCLLGAARLYKIARACGVRTGFYRLMVGVLIPGRAPEFFGGELNGKIVPPKGNTKRYPADLIFMPNGSRKRYAQMTFEEMSAISHRGKALRKVRKYLKEELCHC